KNLIILAETVLDEIDTKKSGFDEIKFQAREFARILEDSNIISSTKKDLYKIIRFKIYNKDTVIDIISKDEYEINSNNVSLNIINDRKILEISTFANTY
ncbi:phosphate starvation-inducible protein PhoH, partial [Aliarcobacter butzleri]